MIPFLNITEMVNEMMIRLLLSFWDRNIIIIAAAQQIYGSSSVTWNLTLRGFFFQLLFIIRYKKKKLLSENKIFCYDTCNS